MDKAQEFLKSWILEYIKNRDLITRQIVTIKEETKHVDIFIEYKDKKQVIVVQPQILDIENTLIRINSAKNDLDAIHSAIVLLNSKENLKTVLDAWEKITEDTHLSFYFVNPFSNTNKIWIVYPSTHNKISTKSTLKVLFDTVEETSVETIKERI